MAKQETPWDIPTPENIEASKLEWGAEFGLMSWYNAQEKIAELNSKLAEGEKPWRLPTKDELTAKWGETKTIPAPGFYNEYYWSSTEVPDEGTTFAVTMVSSKAGGSTKNAQHCVRLVR